MKEIGSRDLADLLNREQFEGIANFSGLVSIRLGGSKGLFYDAKGNFSLEKYGRALESTYALRYKESKLFFKPTKGVRIESHHHEGYGDIISLEIDFPVRGTMQITPQKCVY